MDFNDLYYVQGTTSQTTATTDKISQAATSILTDTISQAVTSTLTTSKESKAIQLLLCFVLYIIFITIRLL